LRAFSLYSAVDVSELREREIAATARESRAFSELMRENK